jgi:hypothetical protein
MPKLVDILCGGTVALALMGAVIAAVPRPAATERPGADQAHAQAMAYARAQQPAAAYGRLVKLADAGHAPSAEAALLMLRNGKAMFGAEWSASAEQQRRWFALAFKGACDLPVVVDNGAGD